MKTETSHIKTAIMLVSETGMASARLLLKEFPEAEIFTPAMKADLRTSNRPAVSLSRISIVTTRLSLSEP